MGPLRDTDSEQQELLAVQSAVAFPALVAQIGIGSAAVFYGTQRLAKALEDALDSDTKLEISLWLLDADVSKRLATWQQTFARLFDIVFTRRHLSWACFGRSALATATAVSFMTLSIAFYWVWQQFAEADLVRRIGTVLIVQIAINILPDYLALLKTRYSISLLQKRSDAFFTISVLTVDALVGLAIAGSVFVVATKVQAGHTGLSEYWENEIVGGPCVIGSLITSVWLWLYALSGVCFRMLGKNVDAILRLIKRRADVEKPVQILGFVSGVFLALAYALWVIGFHIRAAI